MITKINKISNYNTANYIIYTLKNMPIIKKIFVDDDVSDYVVKDGISKFISFLKFIYSFVLKLLLISIISIFYEDGVSDFHDPQLGQFIIILLSFELIAANVSPIFKLELKDYLFVKQLKFKTMDYVKSRLIIYLTKTILFTFIIFYLMLDSLPITILLALGVPAIRLIYEFFYLRKLMRTKHRIVTNFIMKLATYPVIFTTVLLIFNSVVFGYLGVEVSETFAIILLVVIILFAIYIVYYFLKKFNFKLLFAKNLTPELYAIINSKVAFSSLSVNYKMSKVDVRSNKKGYEYLYDIFNKKYSKSLIIKAIILPCFFAMFMLEPYIGLFVLGDQEYLEEITLLNSIIGELNPLFLIIPLTLMMQNASLEYMRVCHLNMDRTLNNYKFFKNKRLLHMKLRLEKIIKYDLISTIIVYIPFLIYFPSIKTIILYWGIAILVELFNISLIYYCYFEKKKSIFLYEGKRASHLDIVLRFFPLILIYKFGKYNIGIYMALGCIMLMTVLFTYLIYRKEVRSNERN